MITLGVDLASLPARTAACAIEWTAGRARVVDVACGQDDDALRKRIAGADKVGLDVPFGWPDAFADAVARFHAGGAWPEALHLSMISTQSSTHLPQMNTVGPAIRNCT